MTKLLVHALLGCALLGSSSAIFSQSQLLLRGATPSSLQAIGQLNAQLGVRELRDLSATPGNVVFSVPDASKSEWIKQLKTINVASPSPFGVTALSGDYRSLFHRLPSTQTLTAVQQSKLEELRQGFGADKVNLVKLAPRALVLEAVTAGFDTRDGFTQSGSVSLPLEPGRTVNLTQESRTPTQGGFLWRGKTNEAGSALDEATFISSGDNMTGTVRLGREVYTYLPLGEGVHAVTKQSTAEGPPEHPPRMLEKLKKPSNKDAPPSDPLDIAESAQIDVLVIFSAKAAAGLADLTALATLAIEDANKSFRDSGIPSVTLRLVNVSRIAYKEMGAWDEHLNNLANSKTSDFKTIRSLREQHRADIVVLVVKDERYCGEAQQINTDDASAFAVVSRTCLLAPRYSFAHELGHLLGARHDMQTDSATTPFRWGHGYVKEQRWRTLMSYDVCGGCPRILRWSNPDMKFGSDPTGTTEYEHDARVWLEQGKRAAGFR